MRVNVQFIGYNDIGREISSFVLMNTSLDELSLEKIYGIGNKAIRLSTSEVTEVKISSIQQITNEE